MHWLIILLIPLGLVGQDTIPHTLISTLPSQLNETSGLELIAGQLWTFNDSGGAPELYQLDTITGSILRTVNVFNASNVDWEAIAADDSYVYVGDFGNNEGSRTDLRIYRISRDSLISPDVFSVVADTIRFSYADQTSFMPASEATNFDCEAMVVWGDSIHVFTKRWLDEWTTEYVIPTNPGSYLAEPIDSLNVEGLVTDADLNASNELVLCGYRMAFPLDPFITYIRTSPPSFLLRGQRTNYSFGELFAQIEGITFSSAMYGFIAAEDLLSSPASLWSFEVPLVERVLEINSSPFHFVATDGGFLIQGDERFPYDFEVFNVVGALIFQGRGHMNEQIRIPMTQEQQVVVNIMFNNKKCSFIKSL